MWMLVAKVGTPLIEKQDKPMNNFSSCTHIDGVLTRNNLI